MKLSRVKKMARAAAYYRTIDERNSHGSTLPYHLRHLVVRQLVNKPVY